MFCPCCAGRTHDVDESGNFDGNGYSPLPGQPGIHRTSEPCKLRIPGDLLGAPLPVIMDLVNTSIVSFRNVLIIHSSQQNSFATVYLIGYTTPGHNDTPYGIT